MKLRHIAALALAVLLMGCDNSEDARAAETRSRLAGSWLREVEADGVRVRRVLALDEGGKFSERALIVTADGRETREEHAGKWTYDGTNLKRKYTHMNGRQVGGGRMVYATYELKSFTRSEFLAKDHVGGRELSYGRVQAGTLP